MNDWATEVRHPQVVCHSSTRMTFAALVVLGYLLGSCPWGYWLVRIVKHEDIRRVGSREHRRDERLAHLRTLARRAGRGARRAEGLRAGNARDALCLTAPSLGICAGAAAMLGHWRPIFLGFAKGGKMVATCGGVFFGVAPWVALAAGLVWLFVFLTLPLRVARVDRRGHRAARLGRAARLSDVGDRLRRRCGGSDLLPAPGEPAPAACGHREPVQAPANRRA